MFSSSYINTSYDKAKIFNKMDAKLKEIDMELSIEEQNRVAMYLVNTLNVL